jgi:hypothetical protein
MALQKDEPTTAGWTSSFRASRPHNGHFLYYNIGVVKALRHGKPKGDLKPPATHQWLENVGLIVIVILILAVTLTRYWHNIHWSAR